MLRVGVWPVEGELQLQQQFVRRVLRPNRAGGVSEEEFDELCVTPSLTRLSDGSFRVLHVLLGRVITHTLEGNMFKPSVHLTFCAD